MSGGAFDFAFTCSLSVGWFAICHSVALGCPCMSYYEDIILVEIVQVACVARLYLRCSGTPCGVELTARRELLKWLSGFLRKAYLGQWCEEFASEMRRSVY